MGDFQQQLDAVPVEFVDGADVAAVKAALAVLPDASAVAIDTETVYDGNDEVTWVSPSGEEVTYKRNLDVDGPGSWRVMSVAARFGPIDSASYRCWVFDMRDANFSVFDEGLRAVRPYGWNANFDRGVLARDGVNVRFWWDVMLIDAVVRAGANGSDSSRYSSLANAALREFRFNVDGKDTTRLSYDAVSDLTSEQVRYAAVDALLTLWLGDRLGARARSLGLAETVQRECAAQPLISQMTTSGLPIDVQAYLDQVVRPAQAAAADAAERLAVLTTGATLLATVARWADHRDARSSDDDVEAGLAVLRSPELFSAFIADTTQACSDAKAAAATAFGGSVDSEDLFSDTPVAKAPFDLDDENDIRRYLSKTVPVFASAVVASTVHSHMSVTDAEKLASSDPGAFEAACAGKKRLVKAHDLDDLVLPALAASSLDSVSDQVKAGAAALANYRRFRRILDTYGDQAAPVRLRPDWKVSAADAVKNALNTFSTDNVHDFFVRTEGKARLLGKTDSVDHDSLVLIGGPIASALLEFRKNEKVVTTYGEDFLKFVHPVTGRIHAKYAQALTGTGRLSSSAPNAQNLPPAAKAFLRPEPVDGQVKRVLVAADLSQAELRYVADQSGDDQMLSAFAAGEDLHTRTASLMFDVDLLALKSFDTTPLRDVDRSQVRGFDAFWERFCTGSSPKVDPSRSAASLYKELRQKAKRVAFGYAYGLKGASLGQQLTVDGVETSKEEADELLALFDQAYPAVAAWMAQRVSVVSGFSSSIINGEVDVDFNASWRLHSMFAKAAAAVSALKSKLGYTPSDDEVSQFLVPDEQLAERIDQQLQGAERDAALVAQRESVTSSVAWVRSFDYPVVLTSESKPWMFSSRTAGGRVRWFPILTRDWEWGMVTAIVRSRDSDVVSARDQWVKKYNESLDADVAADRAAGKVRREPTYVRLYKAGSSSRPRTLFGKELEKQFEDRSRRTDLVRFVLEKVPSAATRIMREGMADRVRAVTNQYRNHPVQGGVADAMLVAMARIDADLQSLFPSAFAIQSVHDSLVVECDVEHAREIRELMVAHMEQGLNDFCPNVAALADADIQLSLDDKTILTDSELDELIASSRAA